MISRKTLHSICQEIYQRYPQISGVQPKVQRQSTSEQGAVNPKTVYVITFQKDSLTSDQKKIPQRVRVTVSEQGRILKVVVSR